jgi:hypothetical protein
MYNTKYVPRQPFANYLNFIVFGLSLQSQMQHYN